MISNIKDCVSALLMAALFSITADPCLAFYGAPYEPPDGRVYHGLGWGLSQQIIYDGVLPDDKSPLILQTMSDIPGTRGMTVRNLTMALTQPIRHPDSQYIELGVHFKDADGALDSAFAYTNELDHYMDTMAVVFNAYDRPFFLRIGYECNGAWNGYSPYTYVAAWRKLVEGLRARNVDNFASVWCYEPDASEDFADSTRQGWKWYPGDDIVDWFGLDVFDADHFDPVLPDSSGGHLTEKGRSEMFLRFAHERGKPVMLNETSACHVFITPDSLDPGGLDGRHDWEFWFEPFFEFISIHPNIKAVEYIDLDWTLYDTYQTWGDARIEINSYIRDRWIPAISHERFLHAGYDITSVSDLHEDDAAHRADVIDLRCYPNPFNGATGISFNISFPGHARLEIYNISGQLVETVLDEIVAAGHRTMNWNASAYSSGIYFSKLTIDSMIVTGKMLLIK